MANSLLTPTAVTRESLRILHERLAFIGTINRQYDDSYARTGAKIGDSLAIRLPNEYTVRTSKTLQAQDTEESSVTVTMGNQYGVDMQFSTAELTLDIDDFSSRIIEPAMAVLASKIEAEVLQGVMQDCNNLVGTYGTEPTNLLTYLQARQRLNQELAPMDGQRFIQVDSGAGATLINGLDGLFHHATEIKRQYREGMMGRAAGFDWYENERVHTFTATDDITTVAIDDAAGTNLVEGTTTLHIDGLGTTFPAGTVFNIAGVNAVHPETKDSYGRLMDFVVVSDPTIASNEADVTISPAIYSTGAKQNVDALPSDNDALTFPGSPTVSTAYQEAFAYHKDVATFVSADLVMPGGVDFAAREVYDGISMRIVRQYDVNNDNLPCRVDVLWGWKTIRPRLGCRIAT